MFQMTRLYQEVFVVSASGKLQEAESRWEVQGQGAPATAVMEGKCEKQCQAHGPHSWGVMLCSDMHKPQSTYKDSAEHTPVTVQELTPCDR